MDYVRGFGKNLRISGHNFFFHTLFPLCAELNLSLIIIKNKPHEYKMLSIFKNLRNSLTVFLAILTGICSFTSCSGVYEDLEECNRGVVMRFVFDYNLEFANSFYSQVDCLTLFVFDENGNLVTRRVETSSVLQDEDWRMTLDLPAGRYHAVAYGGLECDKASFSFVRPAESVRKTEDLEVLINEEYIGEESERPDHKLHDLFHGALDFTVTEGLDYDQVTLRMMRNTNNIRIVLQHIDYTPVDDKDFRFEIIDDNTHFNHENNILPEKEVIYTPWISGTQIAGVDGRPVNPETESRASADNVQVGFAELSVSRLMHPSAYTWTHETAGTQHGPRLRITAVKDSHTVIDVPLTNYLLLLKSEAYKMDDQQFLDRGYNYDLVLFLDRNNCWVRMNIIVMDWIVRINNIDY